jgi:uncharacterized surface protein with fasciclin (FAS1) repeats
MADILETIRNDASLKTLLDYLGKTGLVETLQGKGPYTLFAPDNDAFVRMNIADFLKDTKNLSETLTYHLAAGIHSVEAIGDMETLETETGKSLTIALDEGEIVVDNAKFVKTDIECSNGMVHIIDNVFQPHLSGWYREE